MTKHELAKVLETLLKSCGRVKEDTVCSEDPTSRTRYEAQVFMQFGFGNLNQNEGEAPDPEMVTVRWCHIWDTEIQVYREDNTLLGKVTIRTNSHHVSEFANQIGKMKPILERLVFEGEWSKPEHPMLPTTVVKN